MTIPINENHSDMVKFGRGDSNLKIVINSLLELCQPSQPSKAFKSMRDNTYPMGRTNSPVFDGNTLSTDDDHQASRDHDIVLQSLGDLLTSVQGELSKS